MTALKAQDVARFLARPDLTAGVFLCYGPDTGLVRETAQALVRHFTGENTADTEIVTLDGGTLDDDPTRLAVETRTQALFSARRIIRVRGAGKALAPTLAPICEDPQDAIVILEAGNLAPKDALRALIEASKNARALPCYADNAESIGALIRDTFAKNGIRAEPEAVALLRANLGNDREITRRELDKLVLYTAASKLLTVTDVATLCADNAALVLDEIVDAAGTGHAQKLEDAVNRAIGNGIDPQRLLATALLHFNALRRFRADYDAGRSPRDVLEAARPKPHFSRRNALEQQIRLWSDSALAQAGERLQTAIGESRRKPLLAETLYRRTLLALCLLAAER